MSVKMGNGKNDHFFLNLLVQLVKRSQQLNPEDVLQVIGTFPNYLANDTEVISWERGIQACFSQKSGIPEDEITDHVKYVMLSVNKCTNTLRNSQEDYGDVSDVISCLELLTKDGDKQLVIAAFESPVAQATEGFKYDLSTICAFSTASEISNHFE